RRDRRLAAAERADLHLLRSQLGLDPPRRRRGHRPLDPRRPGGPGRRHGPRAAEARAPAHQRPRHGRDPPRRRRLLAGRRGRPRARRARPDDAAAPGLTLPAPPPPAGGLSMTSTLITRVRERWTRDPALGGPARPGPTTGEPGGPGRDDPGRPGAATDEQVRRDAALVIEGGRIAWTGPAAAAPSADEAVDLGGRAVLPGWVDSHSHLVFDGDRAAEFEARMAGQSYSAGGIGVTTDATRAATDEQLRALVRGRIAEAVAGGTTTLETKT